MPIIKDSLKKLYRTHGAMTFLLAFYPMLPQVAEIHTKGYLSITRILTGSVTDIDEVIKIMFGQRGLKAYEEYRAKHPDQIFPTDIFDSLYDPTTDTKDATELIQKMFFDKGQRSFSNSDKNRAAIIMATTEILRRFPKSTHQEFRNTFITQLSNQAILDQSLISQITFIETSLRLLTQLERHKQSRHRRRLHFMFADMEAKIKAEIAGKSIASTAPIRAYKQKQKNPILLTEENAAKLHEVLLLLAVSPATEVRDEAKKAILKIEEVQEETKKIKT